MVSTSTKFALNKRKIEKKIRFHLPEKLLPLLGTNKSKKTGVHLISVMLSNSRKKF